jgi:FtsP/CotA-like multicopper oxidase with cupredoxin domain
MYLLNGQSWEAKVTEIINVGSTEDWSFVDLTGSNHLMHIHLIQFQIVSTQAINATKYETDWIALQRQALGDSSAVPPWPDDFTPKELPVQPYLIGNASPPPPNEQGWKDTVQTYPYTVTTIRVRFAQQDGSPFPFDPTQGPGYVWHCHMVDHEDNMMMRPFILVSGGTQSQNQLILFVSVIIITSTVVAILFLRVNSRKAHKLNKAAGAKNLPS